MRPLSLAARDSHSCRLSSCDRHDVGLAAGRNRVCLDQRRRAADGSRAHDERMLVARSNRLRRTIRTPLDLLSKSNVVSFDFERLAMLAHVHFRPTKVNKHKRGAVTTEKVRSCCDKRKCFSRSVEFGANQTKDVKLHKKGSRLRMLHTRRIQTTTKVSSPSRCDPRTDSVMDGAVSWRLCHATLWLRIQRHTRGLQWLPRAQLRGTASRPLCAKAKSSCSTHMAHCSTCRRLRGGPDLVSGQPPSQKPRAPRHAVPL